MKEGERIFIEKLYEIVGQKNINKLKKDEIRKLEMMGIDIGGVGLKKLVSVLVVGLIIGLAGGIWMGECIKPMPDVIVSLSNSVVPFLKPVSNFSYSPEKTHVNETIAFNASQSYDPNGEIEEYQWDFGDGENGSSKTVEVNHTYFEARSYTVKLTVKDNDGATASESKEIIIHESMPTLKPTSTPTLEPTPTPELLTPIANFSYTPESPYANETIVFDASQSYDPNGEIEEYQWDFGDGKNESVTTVEVNHTYSEAKRYTVKLTVRDNDGTIASESKEIDILFEPETSPSCL